MLIDTHCHLSGLSESEISEQIANAKENGVERIIAIGSGYGFKDNTLTLNLTKKYPQVFCTLGMHPHEAAKMTEEDYLKLSRLIVGEKKVVAVGETGLDYHYMHSPKDIQQAVFNCFIALAGSAKKPLVIHDRDCGDECVQMIKKSGQDNLKGVVHCFSGNKGLAKKYLDLGFMISFTGIITFPKADDLREIVKTTPLDRIMVETDSPFLAPVPYSGKTNQPAYVKNVAESVAQVKGLDFEEVAKVTTENAVKFFDLSP